MFELEIMVAGYTVLVAATSLGVCKCVTRKQFKKINSELSLLKKIVMDNEEEIKRLKIPPQ